MSEQKSVVRAFGGARRMVLLVGGLALFLAFQAWDRQGSASAIGGIAKELGLRYESNGKRHTALGNIDGVGVTLKTTFENLAGETEVYTDISLDALHAPPGRIAAASVRRKAIEKISGDERVLTGDAAFDEAVYVVGPRDEMLAHLRADARTAVAAATAEGWALNEAGTWNWRQRGHMHNAERMRTLLDLGLAAATTSQWEGDIEEALPGRADAEPLEAL